MDSARLGKKKSDSLPSRASYGKQGGWVSILVNFLLFAVKGVLGFMTGSVALTADAFHSLSDMGTSLIVLITFYISEKPSDREHPFGHGRAEFISAIIMSTILAITSFELMKYGIDRIIHPVVFVAEWWIIGVVLATVVVKEIAANYTGKLSGKIKSATLRADSWHHHLDAITSLLVVISFIFSHYHFPYLDGPVGVIIALVILYSAYGIAKSPIDNLLGKPPDEQLLTRIEEIALSFPQVRGVHDIIIHNYGEMMIISLDIEVDETLTLIDAHRISEEVDDALRRDLNAYVTVHYDPVMARTPLYREVEKKIRQFCRESPECAGFHDLRVYEQGEQLRLLFDLVIRQEAKKGSDARLVENCKTFIAKNIPGVTEMNIKVEPKFSVSRKSRND